jgi:DNA mismatch endonuclease (patch repair protein)
VIFVHGCFWHRHRDCRFAYTPKSRKAFWLKKFRTNLARDRRVCCQLRRLGWRVLVFWECQTINKESLSAKIIGLLGNTHLAA